MLLLILIIIVDAVVVVVNTWWLAGDSYCNARGRWDGQGREAMREQCSVGRQRERVAGVDKHSWVDGCLDCETVSMYCEAAGGLLLAWSYDDESTYSGEVQVKILRAVVASFVRWI